LELVWRDGRKSADGVPSANPNADTPKGEKMAGVSKELEEL
jgi:hypothetical protein